MDIDIWGLVHLIRWFKDHALTLKELLIALDIGKGIDRIGNTNCIA